MMDIHTDHKFYTLFHKSRSVWPILLIHTWSLLKHIEFFFMLVRQMAFVWTVYLYITKLTKHIFMLQHVIVYMYIFTCNYSYNNSWFLWLLKTLSLRFVTNHANGKQMIIWMRTETQGNKWHFVDLSFADIEEPIKVWKSHTLYLHG